MEVTRWLVNHGASLLEAVGIIGGLIFTGVSLHRDSKARRIGNLIGLTQQQRDIWNRAMEDPELVKVQEPQRDIMKEPPTTREKLFVRSLVIYLATVHRAVRLDELLRPHGMERDIREFISKPLPRDVWNELRPYQDPDFVEFVEQQIKEPLN